MGTINSAFSLISGALNADQAGLSIIAGNVANANTSGYTREAPTWKENTPVTINGLAFGTGVTQTGAQSLRDRVLLERLNQQQELSSASSSRLDALNNIQALFTPATDASSSNAGELGTDLTSFFNAFSSLEVNPTNNALRQQVLSKASTLAADVSSAARSLNDQQAGLDQQANAAVNQINALAKSIADLDVQIQSASPNADAGVLEDQRQSDLSALSKLMGIHQVTTENNGLTITTASGQTLISHDNTAAITAGSVNGVTHFFMGSTDVTAELAAGGGTLGGTLTARDQDIPSVLTSLDQLAFGVTTEVNAQNKLGTDLNGNAGSDIFLQSAQVAGSASAMAVAMTDPNGIAAAGNGLGTGDNSNAIALADLANQAQPSVLTGLVLPNGATLAAGATLLNAQTPTNFYSGFVTMLGATVSQVQTQSTAQDASVSQLQTQIDSLSSVNLNDEAAAMTTLERSYQAASQVFAILNNIMSAALNLGTQSTVS